jgi:hypothetical protein
MTGLEVCEKLNVDEFIAICELALPHNFEFLSIRRDSHGPVVFIRLDNGQRERISLGTFIHIDMAPKFTSQKMFRTRGSV